MTRYGSVNPKFINKLNDMVKTRSNKVLRRKDNGGRYKILSHPPSFTSGPWWNLTVRIDSPGAIITTLGLRDQMSSQIGSGTVNNFQVRLQSVRFWGSTGTSGTSGPSPINILIHDPIAISAAAPSGGTGGRILEQITDYPDVVNRAAFGYKYPKAQRDFSLALTGTAAGNLFITNGMGSNSVVYINLQWRFAPSVPPSFGEDLASELEAIALSLK